jgi:hypothetical protein
MRIITSGVAVALALLLVGCVPADPVVTPVPVPSSTPLFATDADALKAATEAYAAYLAMSDRISADGGADAERIAPFVGDSELGNELRGFAIFRTKGYSTSGSSTFNNVALQQVLTAGKQQKEVVVYLCSDATSIRLIAGNGSDITPADRADRQPFEATFISPVDHHALLVLTRNTPWSGSDIC